MFYKEGCIKLLNALVAQNTTTAKQNNFNVTYTDSRLVLFKTIPGLVGSDWESGEITLSGYTRRPIRGNDISGSYPMFGSPAAWDSNESSYKITNTSSIQMHSIDESENRSERVLGFGIVSKVDDNTDYTLLCWGPLIGEDGTAVDAGGDKDDAPTLSGGSVPIFLEGDFILLFGGAQNTGLESSLCIQILNALVLQGSTDGEPTSTSGWGNHTISTNIYEPRLALFQTLPSMQGAGGTEVPERIESDPEDIITGYSRKNLYGAAPTSQRPQFAKEASFSGSDMKYFISNTDEIQMQSIRKNLSSLEWTVLGFGIYAKNTSSATTERLVAWGPIIPPQGQPNPTLSSGAAPTFYTENFKLLLGGDTSGYVWVPVTGVEIQLNGEPVTETIVIENFSSTIDLTASVTPNNASDKSIVWTTENDTIATVENGHLKASSAKGTTIIKAEGTDGVFDSCTVENTIVCPSKIQFRQGSIGSAITEVEVRRMSNSSSLTTGFVELQIIYTPNDIMDQYKVLSDSLTSIGYPLITEFNGTGTPSESGFYYRDYNAQTGVFKVGYYSTTPLGTGVVKNCTIEASLATSVYGKRISNVITIKARD